MRLARLRNSAGHYLWLALDHGLTFGAIDGLDPPTRVSEMARLPGVTALVLNRGLLRFVSPEGHPSLVLQTFGGPLLDGQAVKNQLVMPLEALSLAADAIAVELNLNAVNRDQLLVSVAKSIGECVPLGLPVLAMVTPMPDEDDGKNLHSAIRMATELGADLIKVGLPDEVRDISQGTALRLRKAVEAGPPVLLASGGKSEAFQWKLSLAHRLAFSGVCAGRNVFQANDAAKVVETIRQTFSQE